MDNVKKIVRPGRPETSLWKLYNGWDELNAVRLTWETSRAHKSRIRRFILGGHIAVPSQITAAVIQTHLVHLVKGCGMSQSSANQHLSSIRAFCNHLVVCDHMNTNPCKHIRPCKVKMRPPKYLRPEQIEKVLEVAGADNNYCNIVTAIYSGLRRGELMAMDWRDLNFKNKILQVPDTKSGKPRSIPLADILVDVLGGLNKTRRNPQEGYVFVNKFGRRCHKRQWDRMLDNIKAECPGWLDGWHTFRHTFASILAQKGVSLAKISRWLGHRNYSITLKYYANFAAEVYDPDINF